MNFPIRPAQLPQSYQNARNALAECQAIDECKDWADKAAALASYAKQAEDIELEQMAARIRARAMRRAGELLKQFDGRNGQNLPSTKMDASVLFSPTQARAGRDAGFSERQIKTAVRIANIPQKDFDGAVESANPPTISTLALQGMRPRPVQPEQWLQGRDPSAFNKVLHFVAAVEEYADELASADLQLILQNLSPADASKLRSAISRIDPIHDRIVTRI